MQRLRFAPGRWNLEDALPSGEGERTDRKLEEIRAKAKRFEGLRAGMGGFSREELKSALGLYEEVVDGLLRTSAQAYMRYSTDTADQQVKATLDLVEDLRADVDNTVLFFRLWWTALDGSTAASLTPENPDYRYLLGYWRKLKPHVLDEKVEQAVNLKNVTGFLGWTHHYDQVTSGFTFTMKVRGEVVKDASGKPKKMVAEEVIKLFASPDPARREGAYRALLGRYAEEGAVVGEVYRTIVRDWRNEYVKMRGYPSAIAMRNLENDVPDRAVDTLLAACRKNAFVFQDFFRLKAKILGRKMTRYHIYAPLALKEKKVGYGEAVNTVIDAYNEFDPRVAELVKKVFEEEHVDASPRRGKTHGAYCYSITPKVVPYVFLNFAGVTRDVYTIAHELGHAIHGQLASSHSVLTFQPPLVLAETASVFGEMILFDKFMREEKDVEMKRAVLLEKITSMYSTIARQAYFVVFESQAHPAVNEGATVSDLCTLYSKSLRDQFGSAVEVPEEFKWEWTYIPHIFHTPFYCYAYAFGNLLSLALYDAYSREGREFVPKYLKLLAYGGSKSPAGILGEVGVDISSAKLWESGFGVIRRMVRDLQKL
ncbi:MAG: M3 family oligoendopeptidase [Candidatus Gagatemarchaeaceae archaeon]